MRLLEATILLYEQNGMSPININVVCQNLETLFCVHEGCKFMENVEGCNINDT